MKKLSQIGKRSPKFFALIAILCAGCLLAHGSIEEALLARVRANVADNLRLIPRYTCVQTVDRTRFTMPDPPRSCAESIALQAERVATWRDRLRLDVAVGDNSDMYSWVGASRFDNDQVRELAARGMSASGEFSALLAGVFGGDAQTFQFLGNDKQFIFSFATPLANSHYSYSTANGRVTVGYHGSFSVDPDPDAADLRQLNVEAENLPANVCRMASSVNYARMKIGSGDFVLPVTSSVDVLYLDGAESKNETSYTGCRQYTGESTVTFDGTDTPGTTTGAPKVTAAPPPPIPPRTHLRVHIEPPIDTKTAAAGDPVTGVIDEQVKEKGRVIIATGDKLHGRLLRMEQITPRPLSAMVTPIQTPAQMKMAAMCQQCVAPPPSTHPEWILTVVFDTIEQSGLERKIALKPLDDGYRYDAAHPGIANSDRPPGGGIFIFHDDGHPVPGPKFESSWETQ